MMKRKSPYMGKPMERWSQITRRLVEAHPLSASELADVVETTWQHVWSTRLTTSRGEVVLAEMGELPAQVVSFLLEQLIALELSIRFPGSWRPGKGVEDKDLVFVADSSMSIEVKCSGQRNCRIYGNRSYAQVGSESRKEKSGYYLTVTFHGQQLCLTRFGWIDETDWRGQDAPTGQMASLEPYVYEHKLLVVSGPYRQLASCWLVPDIGEKRAHDLAEKGIRCIGDMITAAECPEPWRQAARRYLTQDHS